MHLPITGNNAQPSGNAANALQTNAAGGVQVAEPFAFLLAQQLGEADLLAADATQIAITVDGNMADGGVEPATEDMQNQAAFIDNQPGAPANMLATMLLAEDRGRGAAGSGQGIENKGLPMARRAIGHDHGREQGMEGKGLTPGDLQKAGDSLQRAVDRSLKADSLQVLAGNRQQADAATLDSLSSDAFKRVEMAIISTSLTQPGASAAQAITAPAMAAVMPDISANHKPAGVMQTITAPLGSNGWANEFSQKITWMGTQQNQVAELRLNPPNLGPLDVVLKISDNQASVLFTSPHGAVREAVENALPKLRELLADNGITLGNATVSDQSSRERNAEGFMNHGSGTAAQRGTFGGDSESSDPASAATQSIPARRHNGMVDTFA